MRKLASILLLTVFCNSLFYYGYFSFSLLKAKLEARLALAKLSPGDSSDILKVPVCRLQRDESDEVWYNNELFDVAERDRINDTDYVFLLRDEEEQDLLSFNHNYFKEAGRVLPGGGHEVTAVKSPPAFSDIEALRGYVLMLPWNDCLFKASATRQVCRLVAISGETPSPPPRRA